MIDRVWRKFKNSFVNLKKCGLQKRLFSHSLYLLGAPGLAPLLMASSYFISAS